MDGILDSVGMSNLLLDFQCIRTGGTVISIADGPDVALARRLKVNWLLWPIFWILGVKPDAAAKWVNARYHYLFMRSDGLQLESMNLLIEQGIIRPIVDRVFPFEQTAQAIAHSEEGKARGKVIIQMR